MMLMTDGHQMLICIRHQQVLNFLESRPQEPFVGLHVSETTKGLLFVSEGKACNWSGSTASTRNKTQSCDDLGCNWFLVDNGDQCVAIAAILSRSGERSYCL